eukprot:GHUV01032766.1.p1 GENE.GHUV01032766.1~~GHUV01032766.1.p1  ORF type:complete len:108 (-),score=33.12 GHUV01032766.1:590-913(-)
MFELNNLALTVPAPVARYKHMLLHPDEAGVDAAEAAAALSEAEPLLEALGDEADAPAEVGGCRLWWCGDLRAERAGRYCLDVATCAVLYVGSFEVWIINMMCTTHVA